jgi:hypothetical protein
MTRQTVTTNTNLRTRRYLILFLRALKARCVPTMTRTTSTQDVETTRDNQNSIEETERLAILPPSDGGKQAWMVLASCSIIQAPAWGISPWPKLPKSVPL